MDLLHQKLDTLKEVLRSYGSAAIAFSGGVDSTFLLTVAKETLGEKTVALTASSGLFPARERDEAAEFCKSRGIRQIVTRPDELAVEGFAQNPPNRCYLCKKELFGTFLKIAKEEGFAYVCEGSNMDDMGDYRPGLLAVKELGIKSPLREAELTKSEIRALSRELGLPTWQKPSFACLASRFVYGETISREKLKMVERAEQLLVDLGFPQFRVRIHGDLARIELLPADLPRLMEEETRALVYARMKEYGFSYVTLDLYGYRSGSMNEVLKKEVNEGND